MKLLAVNGSPRGKNSNSSILLNNFLEGYKDSAEADAAGAEGLELVYLHNSRAREAAFSALESADVLVLCFPLYTDAMPGITKAFIEYLFKRRPALLKTAGFIVHSGFPESAQSFNVEAYLERLCRRMDIDYSGTIIKGGSEGLRLMPPAANRKLFDRLNRAGRYFAEHGKFDPVLVEEIKRPYRLNIFARTGYRLLSYTGLTNFYWNMNLKQNGVYKQRNARPFA